MINKKYNLLICGIGRGMCSSLNEILSLELEINIYVISDYFSKNIEKFSKSYEITNPKSYKKVSEALSRFEQVHFDGVINLGYENLIVISRLVTKYKVNGISELVAKMCTSKSLRLSLLRNNGVCVPNFFFSKNIEEIRDYILCSSLPVVVKPNMLTSSLGVSKISSIDEIDKALKDVESYNDLIVVEEYIEGSEHIFEGIIADGNVYITGHADRNYSEKELFYPYFFENGDNLPSNIEKDTALFEQVISIIKKSLSALGVNNLPFHCDLILNDDKIFVQEITSRIAGGQFATKLVPHSNGINIVKNIVRQALGLAIVPEELNTKFSKNVISRYYPSRGGVVSWVGDINILLSFSNNLLQVNWEREINIGDELSSYKSGKDMIASIILEGDSIETLDKLANKIFEKLPIKLKTV